MTRVETLNRSTQMTNPTIKKVNIGGSAFYRVIWSIPFGKDGRTFTTREDAEKYAAWLSRQRCR
jgi:hypothetical protein